MKRAGSALKIVHDKYSKNPALLVRHHRAGGSCVRVTR
jgi:hypothetical protein